MLKDYLEEVKGTEMEFIAEDMINDFEEGFGKDYITTDEWLSEREIAAIVAYNETHAVDYNLMDKLRRLATLMEEEY